jgi:hypothetical protein
MIALTPIFSIHASAFGLPELRRRIFEKSLITAAN